jgi:hypothetical protein
MISGTPSLAKAFCQILNATAVADNIGGNKYNHFVFEDRQIKLRHLQMNGDHFFVDLRVCMGFLTAGADLFVLRDIAIFGAHLQLPP